MKGIQFCSNKEPCLFSRGGNYEIAKYIDENKKCSSPEPLDQFRKKKLGTMHPWVKRIQVCSIEGPRPFPRGDNYEKAKTNLTIFSRTTEPISTKLGINHPLVKEIQFCSNEGPCHFPRGDYYE